MEHMEIFLQGVGIQKIVLVKVPANGTVQDILEAARAHGLRTADGHEPLVLLEEASEPLALSTPLSVAGITQHSRVQVHTCQLVEVVIHFQNRVLAHHFSPSTPLRAVTHWATAQCDIPGSDAVDYALQLCSSDRRPTEDTHIGALTEGSGCSVCFDLVLKQRVEG